jgi:hypothetical protein
MKHPDDLKDQGTWMYGNLEGKSQYLTESILGKRWYRQLKHVINS